jgi:hypothetical protein
VSQPPGAKGRPSIDRMPSKSSHEPELTVPTDEFDQNIPDHVRRMLPGDTAQTWVLIAPLMPNSAYLVGGTALTVHLQHRVSRDLDFFLEKNEDLDALWFAFQSVGYAVASERSADTLNCLLNSTKVQVLEATTQSLISPTRKVAGIRVASVGDIMATKINVICGRGELRDYFDLMCIEQQAGLLAETGIALAIHKYDPQDRESFTYAVLRALGSFVDVADDPNLPMGRRDIENYWLRRQLEVARRIDSFGGA